MIDMTLEQNVLTFQQTGDYDIGKDILSQSYVLAQKLIYRKYARSGFREDLFSESHDAIISAIYTFKPDRQAGFLTYCWTCIDNRIKEFFRVRSMGEKHHEKMVRGDCSTYIPIDEVDALRNLSENHIQALFTEGPSRSMAYRAKKNFFKIYNQ